MGTESVCLREGESVKGRKERKNNNNHGSSSSNSIVSAVAEAAAAAAATRTVKNSCDLNVIKMLYVCVCVCA